MADRLALNGLMGAIIGNYRVERSIEQGEWWSVFQVYDRTGTRYLMRFSGNLMADVTPELATARLVFLGHFQQQAKLIAMLQHPHILPLLDYGNFHGLPYLVYPQSAGSSLAEALSTQGPLPLVVVGRYLQQLTSALDYAHQRAVLHRNLSSACIYIQPDAIQAGTQSSALVNGQQPVGRLLISEFGYRRIIELSRTDLRTEADSIRRRPTYDGSSETSAPEQLLGQPIDTYTDVYACGVVLYRLLTGHAPFEGATRDEVARQHLYAQMPSLYMWRKDVPGVLNEVLKRAMAKDPFHRYRRPGDLARAYQDALQAPVAPVPTPTEIVSSRLSVVRPQGKVSRRRILALAGVGSGVAAVGIFAGMRFLQEQAPPTVSTATGVSQATVAQSLPRPTQLVRQIATSTRRVLVHTADLPINSALTFPIANQQRPGVLVHLSDKRFVAFDSTCTHAGCGVEYNPQTRLLECPCHDAAFDPAQQAAVVSGPAQSPLAAISIQVSADGTISLK